MDTYCVISTQNAETFGRGSGANVVNSVFQTQHLRLVFTCYLKQKKQTRMVENGEAEKTVRVHPPSRNTYEDVTHDAPSSNRLADTNSGFLGTYLVFKINGIIL